MSISVGHRAITSAVGWGHSPARRTVELPAAESVPSTAAQAGVEPGALLCSPWEGLYLEQAHPVTARGSEAATRRLDSFLSSLMYGE